MDDKLAQRSARFHAVELAEDQRNEFARDRDRVLYSSALRRLSGVTQVVSAAEGTVFHNRLTHTLKVGQLARRIAEYFLSGKADRAELGGWMPEQAMNQQELAQRAYLDAEVAEAGALAHDLGHPPFGHAAERVLHEKIADAKGLDLADGFEGNAQTFRTVTRLSTRLSPPDQYPGLNLTRATLDAILKYPWLRQLDHEERGKKWGAYLGDAEVFHWVRQPYNDAGTAPMMRSAEAEIMDWADDVAYAVHDVEDFYRAGVVPLDRLIRQEHRDLTEFFDGLARRWEADNIGGSWDPGKLKDVFAYLLDHLGSTYPSLRQPYRGYLDQHADLRAATSSLIRRYVIDVGLRLRSPDDQSGWAVLRPERAEKELALLKELIWQYAILHPSLSSQQVGKRRVISDLFDTYFDAAAKDGPLIPWGIREQLRSLLDKTEEREKTTLYARVACDIICSMSEQQAITMHQRLTGMLLGSVLDPPLS